MKNPFYLLSLTVSGIKSIKKDVRLDFYKKTVDKNFNPERYRVKAIYGENGTGKSAIVTALKILQDLMINDNYLSESKNQIFLDEIINKETKCFKVCCEYIIKLENTTFVYNYSVEIGKNTNDLYEIKYESLLEKNGNYPNNNYQTVFECKNGKIEDVKLNSLEKENIKNKTLNLLSTHSMIYLFITNSKEEISNKADEKIKDLLLDMIMFFTFVMSIRIYLGEEDQHELYFLKKRIKDAKLDKQALGEGLLELGDDNTIFTSVSEKRIEKKYYDEYKKRVGQLTKFVKKFKPQLVSIDIDKKEDGDYYVCDLVLNYEKYKINKEFESTGIKKIIRLFDCFMVASNGGVAFIDEMDSNLNDVYLCKLIEYFMYYGKGQLCFTTHNLDPMIPLKINKNSIDFLTSENRLIPWTSRGNATPDNCYRNGMIEDLPFNIDAIDFIGILGD